MLDSFVIVKLFIFHVPWLFEHMIDRDEPKEIRTATGDDVRKDI